jgi:hypothetical protein
MSDESRKRKSTSPSSSQASTSRARPSSSAGPQASAQSQSHPQKSSNSSRHKPNLIISTPSHPGQETGFAALRTHLSSFLSVQSHDSSSVPTLRHPSTTLQILTLFLKRLAFSKMFNTILVFFLIVGVWRRRLGRTGSSSTNEVGKYWKKAKEKILETVKMGGSLGYL